MKDLTDNIEWPKPGCYVVALSGGPDSVALLDLLAAHRDADRWRLEVAHFDHGWGPQSKGYAELSRRVAVRYSLPFHSARRPVVRREAEARDARYKYLREVIAEVGAKAIITGQHQDDLVETMVMNLQRGTGRRGLSPFETSEDVIRPLVHVRKAELLDYARERGLEWYEDLSNTDLSFRRNAVRKELSQMDSRLHASMAAIAEEAAGLNRRIDEKLLELFNLEGTAASADREHLRRMPITSLMELLVFMARAVQPGAELDRLAVEQLALDVKTGRLRSARQLTKRLSVGSTRDRVTIVFTA